MASQRKCGRIRSFCGDPVPFTEYPRVWFSNFRYTPQDPRRYSLSRSSLPLTVFPLDPLPFLAFSSSVLQRLFLQLFQHRKYTFIILLTHELIHQYQLSRQDDSWIRCWWYGLWPSQRCHWSRPWRSKHKAPLSYSIYSSLHHNAQFFWSDYIVTSPHLLLKPGDAYFLYSLFILTLYSHYLCSISILTLYAHSLCLLSMLALYACFLFGFPSSS